MKNNRKIIAILLILALVLCTACGSKDKEAEEVIAEEVVEEVETEILPELTLRDAIELVRGLSPKKLGLEGSSMEEYEIRSAEGIFMVDEVVCSKLMVYKIDEKTGTNAIQGTYLIARDASALYELDGDEVKEILKLLA